VSRPGIAAALVLAQLAACGSCVKDDPTPADPVATGGRKPIDVRAFDKRLSQFSEASADGAAD
jgi:hypothetical protein